MLVTKAFHWGQRGLLLCLWTILCGAAMLVAAQEQGSISGTVKDQSGAAVAGATVQATNAASGRVVSTTTDGSGKYELKGLSAGPYRVLARQSGFSDSGVSLNVSGGESVSQDFSLNVGTLEEEVTVTAAKGLRASSEIPQTVTTITAADIELRRPVGVADTYDRAPSMSQTDPNPFRARPEIRGLQSARVLVLVDGERLNNARFGADFVGVSPSLVDPTQINTVEVVGGSSSSLYGSDAIGGTINITTKGPERALEGSRIGAKLSGDYGSNSDFRRGAVTLSYGIKQFAISTNYSHFIQPNYHIGGQSVSRAEVVRFGQFAQQAGGFALPFANNVAASYPVYDLAANQEISNSGARGTSFGADMMFFLGEKQRFRIRGQRNDFSDLGVPFTSRPFSTNRPETGISRLDKISLRYEASDITPWFARFSVSYYYQKYRRSLDEERSAVCNQTLQGPPFVNPRCPVASISTNATPPFATVFTGNPSVFLLSANAQTFNDNSGPGFDAQANFLPFRNAIYTTGVNYSLDKSRDRFSETRYSTTPDATFGNVIGRVADVRNTPNSDYKNLGWYNQFEYTAMNRVRLAAGFRIDNWKTEAKATPGFPVGRLTALSLALIPVIRAAPGGLNAAGFTGLDTLVSGSSSLSTSSTVGTYNVSATALLNGFNPYIRYSTSFREPEIIARYLVRDFSTSASFSLPSLINSALKPERGRDVEVGIKVDRRRFRGSAGYYRNQIKDAIGTALGGYCITANAAAGFAPTPAFFGFGCIPNVQHFSQVFQSVNFSEVVLKGFEMVAEADLAVGDAGTFTPYFTFNTLHAQNKTNDPSRLNIIRNLYNSSAPLPLEGSVTDVPFYSLPPRQATFSPRFTGKGGKWFAEYEYRWTARSKRIDPNEISFAGTTTYANFASYAGIRKQSIRGGFRVGGEQSRVSVSLGVENLANKLYFLRFQPAPAPGRSFTVGTTINLGKKF